MEKREQPLHKIDHRPKTRQLKEAGASTNSPEVIINNVKTRAASDTMQDKTCQFKPANETLDSGDSLKNTKNDSKQGSSLNREALALSKKKILSKAMSSGSDSYLHEENLMKFSTKMNSQILQTAKSANITVTPSNSEELAGNNEASSAQSHTMSTKEEASTKRNKEKDKPSQEMKVTSTENKYPEEGPKEAQKPTPKSISKVKAEEICLKWI